MSIHATHARRIMIDMRNEDTSCLCYVECLSGSGRAHERVTERGMREERGGIRTAVGGAAGVVSLTKANSVSVTAAAANGDVSWIA